MALLKPDPSFYASPREAAQAPPETLAYVATLNVGTNGDRAPDALSILDLDKGSDTFAQLVGRADMPNVGDELHHFGWNACSSALCPWAPHPHVERQYLLVPGLRCSRIHVIDVKSDPPPAEDRQGHRAGGDRREDRLQPPAHDPLRPRRHLRVRPRRPRGRRPRRHLPARPRDFSVKGPWETDRGPQQLPTTSGGTSVTAC